MAKRTKHAVRLTAIKDQVVHDVSGNHRPIKTIIDRVYRHDDGLTTGNIKIGGKDYRVTLVVKIKTVRRKTIRGMVDQIVSSDKVWEYKSA